jgi:hypothetical protein
MTTRAIAAPLDSRSRSAPRSRALFAGMRDGRDHGAATRGAPLAEEQPRRVAAEDGRKLARRLGLGFLAGAGKDLADVPSPKPRKPVESPVREVRDEGHEVSEAAGERVQVDHDSGGYHPLAEVVNPNVTGDPSAPDDPAVVRRTSPIAERVRAYVAERKQTDPAFSVRKLSALAGLNPTQLGMVLKRLDEGGDVGMDTLTSIAKVMGRSLVWLVSGEESEHGVRLGDLPGWGEAAAAVRARYQNIDPSTIEQVAAFRVPEPPAHLDALFIAAVAQAWSAAAKTPKN